MSELAEKSRASNPVLIVAAWMVVAVPALWGVSQTLRTSMNLFKAPAVSARAPAAPAAR